MKKIIAASIISLVCICHAHGQLYLTRTGFIGLYSKTPFEDIKAVNNQVYAIM
jgi:hypothetical protein